MEKPLIFLLFTFFLVGCGLNLDLTLEENENTFSTKEETFISYTDIIAEQWANSAHATPVSWTVGRDGCISCHDGTGFAMETTLAEDINHSSGQTCFTCHTMYGSELKEQRTVKLPTRENFNAGVGALCIKCHNSNGVPDINNLRRASPHYGAQADILSGTGGIRLDNEIQYNNTFGHVNLANTCVDCHMPKNKEGFTVHTFAMTDEHLELVCSNCHNDVESFNKKVKADYDGDGEIEGIQDEFEGLMELLSSAIKDSLSGGSFEAKKGSILFYNEEGELLEEVRNEIYLATYNYYLNENDGSKGVHNPQFVVQLLQSSYRAIVGEDIPNAKILSGKAGE